jgi:hypothetical protein
MRKLLAIRCWLVVWNDQVLICCMADSGECSACVNSDGATFIG